MFSVDSLWKTLIAPMLAALIGAIALNWWSQPVRPTFEASVNWGTSPNPFSSLDSIKALLKISTKPPAEEVVVELYKQAKDFAYVRFTVAEVRNNGRVASKSVEVSMPSGGVLLIKNAGGDLEVSRTALVKSLLPGQSISMLGISRPDGYSEASKILILHDGEVVDLSVKRMREDFDFVLQRLNDHPIWSVPLVMVSIAWFFLCLFMAFASRFVTLTPEQRVRYMSVQDKKDAIEMAEYLRASELTLPNSIKGEK